MGDRSSWNNNRRSPRHPAYNRCSHWRVAWDTRCARSPDNRMLSVDLRGTAHSLIKIADSVLKHTPTGITRGSSVSAVESLVICRPAAQHRTLHSPSNRRAGTCNLITGHSATETIIRETLRRPGPHPHRSVRTSFDPPVIFMHHIDLIRSQDINIIPIQPQTKSCTEICTSVMDQTNTESQEVFSWDAEEQQSSAITDQTHTMTRPVNRSVDWSVAVDNQQADKNIMQISGAGHWFLEGWIGDHAVDFLVDSGSAVTAVSQYFYNTLVEAGAPVGDLRPTVRKLRGANGSQTDAIIGTDTLGSILPHTLDIKNGLLFTDGGVSLQLHRRDAALSGRVFTVGHCSIPPLSEAVLHCTTQTVGGRSLPPSGLLEGLIVFSENTGLVVGRTLVDPSGWKVPVLVSNFVQETVMVEPFSEIGMIAQV